MIINLAFGNVPFEYWMLSLKGLTCSKTVKDKIQSYCNKIDKAFNLGLGLCLYGQYGRGKTFLSTYILKKASLAGYSIYFSTLAEMLNNIRRSFDLSPEQKDIYEYELDKNYIETQFLVIDNVGSEYRRDNSTFVPIIFDEMIRKRKFNNNVTIITTNKEPSKLREVYGEAVYSILESSLKLLKIRGKDNRLGRSEKLWKEL